MTTSTNKSALWKHIGLHCHSVGTFVADGKGIKQKAALLTDNDDVVTSQSISRKKKSFGLSEIEDQNLTFKQCILEDANEEGEEFEPQEEN